MEIHGTRGGLRQSLAHCGVWAVQAPAGRSHMPRSVLALIRRALGQIQAPVPPLLTAPNQTARFTSRSGIRGGKRQQS
jgi:hypothetical protein